MQEMSKSIDSISSNESAKQRVRRGNRKLPLRFVSMCAVCAVVLSTVASIWIPTALVATSSLYRAREDQLHGTVEILGKNIVDFFQFASGFTNVVEIMHNTTRLTVPETDFRTFSERYGVELQAWLSSVDLNAMTLLRARNPNATTGDEGICDTDALQLTPTYTILVDEWSTENGTFSVNHNTGAATEHVCQFLANQVDFWAHLSLPGPVVNSSTGLSKAMWTDGLSFHEESLSSLLIFPLIGPDWARDSSFGVYSVLLADIEGTQPVSEFLHTVAVGTDLEESYFLLSSDGELYGTSDVNQQLGIRDTSGTRLLGLTRANNASMVNDHFLGVAAHILNLWCSQSAGGGLNCSWPSTSRDFTFGGNALVVTKLTDDLADGLDMLLVCFASTDDILRPAARLNAEIAIVACCAIVLFCGASLALTEGAGKIFRSFHKILGDAAEFRNLDEIASHPQHSIFTEVDDMYRNLQNLAGSLNQFRNFLPQTILRDENEDEDVFDSGCSFDTTIPAPSGRATIVFTDIQGFTATWEAFPTGMKKALAVHNKILRACLIECNGYEVKTIGDSFMIAFAETINAARFGIKALEELFTSPWDASLLEQPDCAPAPGYCGVRIRIGMHVGPVETEVNALTQRSDYFGQTVKTASKLERAAIGGTVAVSDEMHAALCAVSDDLSCLGKVSVLSLGEITIPNSKVQIGTTLIVPSRTDVIAHELLDNGGGGEKNHLSNRLATVNNLLRRRASQTQSQTLSSATASNAEHTRPVQAVAPAVNEKARLKEMLAPIPSITAGHVWIGLEQIDNYTDPLSVTNNILSAVLMSLERTEGTVGYLCSSAVAVSWNTARKCSAHLNRAIDFTGMVHDAVEVSEITTHIGLCCGAVLHGRVGAHKQRFVTVIGLCVDTAAALAVSARQLNVGVLTASLPGHQSASLDVCMRGLIRPVDLWTIGGKNYESIVVYQIRSHALSLRYGLNFQKADNVSIKTEDWGWSEAYDQAFHDRAYDVIEHSTEDSVLLEVAENLRKHTHLRRPLTPGYCSGEVEGKK
ncbi:hypothetical protein DIPPA_52611 [Diplonema papillatum]|nr:hypothetical protein DIPPA_52611 [Diplonema papillatum]